MLGRKAQTAAEKAGRVIWAAKRGGALYNFWKGKPGAGAPFLFWHFMNLREIQRRGDQSGTIKHNLRKKNRQSRGRAGEIGARCRRSAQDPRRASHNVAGRSGGQLPGRSAETEHTARHQGQGGAGDPDSAGTSARSFGGLPESWRRPIKRISPAFSDPETIPRQSDTGTTTEGGPRAGREARRALPHVLAGKYQGKAPKRPRKSPARP